jgi:hypothetical protein
MSRTDPSILLCMVAMKLVRNGLKQGVARKVMGLTGVSKGHLIFQAQRGVMGILKLQTVRCVVRALNFYGRGLNNEPGESKVRKPRSKLWQVETI